MDVLTLIRHSLSSDDQNPIYKYFKIGRQIASAGPEMAWRIHHAVRIDDGKEASVFIFEKKIAEKLYKPRRREIVTESLRKDAQFLSDLKHPKILRVLRPLEECHDSIAFATEPVIGSLANLFGNYERMSAIIPNELKDHIFLDIELKYGIMQIAEALSYLHTTEHILHNNVCPQNILITKRGMWRLAGFGFAECSKESQMKDTYTICPCSSKQPKMAQPDLDYIAPEIQLQTAKFATSSCDIFSLGMLICYVYNGGKSLLQASHNCSLYAKQVEKMSDLFGEIVGKLPLALVEPTEKMINKDIRYRPTAQLFMLLKFFDDNIVRCIQAIDVFECAKDLSHNSDLFNKISQVLPQCPRKIQFNTFFPVLKEQMLKPEMLILVLPCVVVLSEFCSIPDYHQVIMPELKKVFCMSNRPVQATVFLLEKLNIFLAKTTEEDIKTDVLPLVFATIESNSIPGQEAAINVFNTIKKYLDDQSMRKLVLPKAKSLFIKSTSVRTKLNALACIDRLLDSLDKMMILDDVLPFLTEINCSDVDIVMSITAIYRHLLSDRMFGLTHSLIATKIMPTLIPYTVCPGLNLDQFSELMEVLFEMLAIIDIQRRTKMISEAPDLKVLEMRRSSMDTRHNEKQIQLMIEDSSKQRIPGSSRELSSLPCPKSNLTNNRRHSSFQGLVLTPNQLSLDDNSKSMMAGLSPYFPRQSSIPASSPPPSILVSKPSVNDFKEILSAAPNLWNKNPGQEENARRSSSHSIGVIEPIRRNSRELLDRLPIANRRPSFHGMCETAIQFFSGKQ